MDMDKATILIVDDNPTNLGVFFEYLEESGFEVSVARSGEGAIRQLAHFHPDLILLDVMMPGMDGFETCRRLKKDEAIQDIPVIFMTALSDSVDKVKGFLAGGADYITKPFHYEEVLVRVTAHLTIRKLQYQLKEQNALLEEKNAMIEEQKVLLKEKDEQLRKINAHKEKLFSFISQDLQSPLNRLLGFARLIIENVDDYSKEEIKGNIRRLQTSAEQLYASHENLLTWVTVQRGTLKYYPESVDIQEIAVYYVLLFTPNAEEKRITLTSSIREPMFAYADYKMVNTVVQNLVSNALKFTNSNGSITIEARQTENVIEISVSDTGTGIREEDLPYLFQIETTSQNKGTTGEEKTGLGLIICKELVEKNGGKIWCESEIGKGTTFTFTLPRKN
jgi:two-component system sensor histidine kinase/response regulator